MDIKIKCAGLHDPLATDQASFILLYKELTKIINDTAVEVFGRIERKKHNVHKIVTNPLIQQLQARSHAISGALRLDTNPTHPTSYAARQTHTLLSTEHSLNTNIHTTLCSFLIAKCKAINKDLYKEQSNEVYTRAKRYDVYCISQALSSGSTK